MPSTTKATLPLSGSNREDLAPAVTLLPVTELELRALAQVLWVIGRNDLEALHRRVIAAWGELAA